MRKTIMTSGLTFVLFVTGFFFAQRPARVEASFWPDFDYWPILNLAASGPCGKCGADGRCILVNTNSKCVEGPTGCKRSADVCKAPVLW